MKKIATIIVCSLLFFTYSCREELDYLNKAEIDSFNSNVKKEDIKSRILNKSDYANLNFVKNAVNRIENSLLSKNYTTSETSKSSLSKDSQPSYGYKVYTDVSEEISYLDAQYNSFYILGSEDGYEEKLVLKSVNQQIVEKYIVRYKRINGFEIDKNSYQTIKIAETSNDTASLMMYIDSFSMGCSTYTVITYNCGHEGNHTNGQYCSVEGSNIPYDVVTVSFNPNCNSSGGGGGGGGGNGGGGGTPTTPPIITIPTSAPIYTTVRPRGKFCNALALSDAEITQINSNYDLRLKIYQYLWSQNAYPFPSTECFGLDSEPNFIKFTLKFFADNPSTTWDEFKNWFIDANSGIPNLTYDNTLLVDNTNSIIFDNMNDLKTAIATKNANITTESSVIEENGNEKVVSARVTRNPVFGSGVEVRMKLQKAGNVWMLDSVTSSEYGITLGSMSFTQLDYTQNTQSNVLTVEVTGLENYNLFLEGIGTVYKDRVMIRTKINTDTGNIFSVQFVDL